MYFILKYTFCTAGGVPETVTDLPRLYKNGFKGCIFKFRVEMKVSTL
jgi:hypothetical protein